MSVATTFAAVMNPQSLRFGAPPIEPLESRIAPALIFVGDPAGDDTEYTDPQFVNTATGVASNDPISLVLGGNADVYYLKLTPGDQVAIFGGEAGGTGYTNYITGPSQTGLKGTVIAVFLDANHDTEVEPGELMGLSLGNNVRIQVSGSVFGDVVANYNDAAGTLGAAGDAKDLLHNSISFFGASTVTGNIIAGGSIQGVNVTSSVNQILTGTAAHNLTYDLNGSAEDGGDMLNVVAVAGKSGPAISKITVGDVTKIQTGGGGAGAAGGKISKVTLISDTDGWVIQGGDGGAGGAGHPKGGNGGAVSQIFANGLDVNTTDSTANDVVQILGGKGGDGPVGGKGGTVKGVSIGYESGAKGGVQRSINSISDSVLVAGGVGGIGRVGGAGGGLTDVKVFASPTLSGNDLVLRAGAGGDSNLSGGKAGAGGSVNSFDVRNPGTSAEAQQSRMFVDAGDGGLTAGVSSAGAAGGSTQNGVFVGFSIGVTGGNGSQGTNGGSGGKVKGILAQDGFFGVRPKNVAIDAGGGGIGTAGKGGKGGVIDGVTVQNPELSQFDINQTVGAGDGADSQRGPGGSGGGVFNITVNDVDTLTASEVVLRISAGDGGKGGVGTGSNGGKGGGIGGKNVLSGINASLLANGGSGGAATNAGSGGAGGGVTNISFVATGDVSGAPVTATISGGTGGNGMLSGKGGLGGSLSTLNVITDGNVALQAGPGGTGGATGGVGRGGNITNAATISAEGSTTVTAGSAGADGGKAGSGGALTQINVQAFTNIEIRSGNGSKGGGGGSIKEIGVSNVTQLAGPNAGLLIIAGNGSANGTTAGAGGSITGVDGFIATAGSTLIQAGEGGPGTSKAGAGGSISTITLRGGGGPTAIVNIEAGNAGDATAAKVGAKGGAVSDVGIGLDPFVTPLPGDPIDPFAVQAGTLIRHIAAGEGGDAGTGKGGVGGTVQEVRAYYDIGAMSGEVFGYATMGGIFAGAGGAGATEGASGSVLNVSADSIAAILAGRLMNGEVIQHRNLAASVEGLVLNSSTPSIVNGNGTYTNYDTASLVGAIRDPLAAGVAYPAPSPHANTFDPGEYVDEGSGSFGIGDSTNAQTDGFVAALKFATSAKFLTSVRPEALLTVDVTTGSIVFIDLNNTNGQKFIL
jgi:hypothetical protein